MKKTAKIYVYILAVTLLLGVGQVFAAWDGDYSKAVRPSSSKDGYFLINNENELAYFSRQAGNNCNAGNIRLMADMDLGGHHFTPLCAGTGDSKFDKIFDGNKFTIKNLYIDSDTLSVKNTNFAQNIGLIAALKGTIKDVNFENAKIYASQDEGKILKGNAGEKPISIGVAVGWMAGGTVSGVNVISSEIRTSGTGQSVGGVVGYVENNTGAPTISNCYSNAKIIAYGNSVYAGGVAGYAKGSNITVSGVVFDGTVNNEGNGKSGGILGKIANNSTIVSVKNCYYNSAVYVSGIGDVTSAGAGNIIGDTTGVQVVNSEEVACKLNGGELDESGVCDKQEPWALGQSGNVSLNGSDGYKITFVSNGGKFPDGAKTFKFVSKGGSINSNEIATPTREGKKFAGWALNADATEPDADLGTATGATKVYAVWYSFYTVSFSAESWESAKTTQVAKHGTITVDGFDVPEPYTKGASEKYFFTGWAYESKFLEEGYDASADDTLHLANIDVVSDVVLHAVWTRAETYSVTFNAMEHGNTDVQFVKIEIVSQGDKVSEPENFVGEEGYTLEGWYTSAERETRYDFDSPITQNIVLYAKWDTLSYNITYENCKEGCVNVNPATYTKASATVMFAKASRNGYTFDGWFYDSDFKTPATQIASGSTGNKTVYAKWTEITYTVRYAAGTNGLGNYPDAIKHVGKDLTLLGAVMRRAGYNQVGWATSDGGEKVYELDATYSEDADLTLYPVWEIVTYTITYVCDGCDVSNETKFPRTFTIVTNNFSIPNPTSLPEGYSFGGWFKNAQFSGKQNNNFTKGTYGDFTFYGKLNKIYKITYVGTENPNNVTTYTVDDEKTFKAPKDSAGYTFGGWFANAEFEGDAVTGIVKGTTGDKTFYAKWIAEEYTITYHNIEGATFETPNPETYTVEDEFPIVLNEPTKVGFNFLGWFLSEDAEEPKAGIAAGSTGEANFYARWELAPSPITVTASSGSFEYDGETHNATCSYEGVIPVGYSIAMVPRGSVQNVSEGDVTTSCAVTITDNTTSEDATALFSEVLDVVDGLISIKAKEVKNGAVTILADENGTRAEINGEYTGEDEYSLDEEITANSVVLNRSFTPYVPVTMTLPFDIAVENVENAKFYVFGGVSVDGNGKKAVEANRVKTGNLMANTPYMVIPTATSITFNGAVVLRETIEPVTQVGNWEFVGTYAYKTVAEENQGAIYGFAGSAEGEISQGQFARFAAGAHFVAMRAYLLNTEISNRRLAKSLYVRSANTEIAQIGVNWNENDDDVPEEQTTTVRRVTKAPSIQKTHRVFDLKGRFINEKSKSKGVYFNR